jgi:hypothetical protein
MYSTKNQSILIVGALIFCFIFSSAIFAASEPEVVPLTGKSKSTNFASSSHYNINPLRETGKPDLPGKWGNDILVASGPLAGGFSVDYDENGFIYAARCTTYADSANAAIMIYKSTDGGLSWFYLNGFGYLDGSQKLSYPYVITGTNPSKLYVFAITSAQNGDLGVARFRKDGPYENWNYIKADADTISYFSVCTDDGSHLMLAYQKEANGHNVYTTVSTDSGTTWGNESWIDDIGSHPDMAYGTEGYVYLVWERNRDGDAEIWFFRHNNYCLSGAWVALDSLTANFSDDIYPKVAALHTVPKDTACVWVVYDHYPLLAAKVTDIDLDFAYSTNSGTNWTKEQVLANDPNAQELAADLRVYRSSTFKWVDLSYLSNPLLSKNVLPEIRYTWSYVSFPDSFNVPHVGISDNWPNWSEDSREVCQVLSTSNFPGIFYEGALFTKEDVLDPLYAGWNLYFDHHDWENVDENTTKDNLPSEFSLSINYPKTIRILSIPRPE